MFIELFLKFLYRNIFKTYLSTGINLQLEETFLFIYTYIIVKVFESILNSKLQKLIDFYKKYQFFMKYFLISLIPVNMIF